MAVSPLIEKAYYTRLQHFHFKHFGKDVSSYEPLTAHGSDRFIVRLHIDDGNSRIGIINNNLSENKAFINFGKHFKACGLNVPEIYAVSDDLSSYLLEDLGDETLLDKIKSGTGEFDEENKLLYKKVIEVLPKFQISAGKDIDYSFCYQFNEFGKENIDYDINYFKQRYLKVFHTGGMDEELLNRDLEFLKMKILEIPRDYFLYRDFQSRNIMIKKNNFFFIDFQSGRKGALLYDLASLLYDAKADIPQKVREELAEYYLNIITGLIKIDLDLYQNYFWYFAIIRILQALGAYGFLGMVKGKSKFLESVPYALTNMNFILDNRIDQKELAYLRTIFKELLHDKT
jgi:aminoglycoside/choline kinase family phosphotransferase